MVMKRLVRLGLLALVTPAVAAGIAVASVSASTPASSFVSADQADSCQQEREDAEAADRRFDDAKQSRQDAEGKQAREDAQRDFRQAQEDRRNAHRAYEDCVSAQEPDEDA